jgi:hypothetical protein
VYVYGGMGTQSFTFNDFRFKVEPISKGMEIPEGAPKSVVK